MVLKHYHSEAATVSNSIISWTIKYILGTLAAAYENGRFSNSDLSTETGTGRLKIGASTEVACAKWWGAACWNEAPTAGAHGIAWFEIVASPSCLTSAVTPFFMNNMVGNNLGPRYGQVFFHSHQLHHMQQELMWQLSSSWVAGAMLIMRDYGEGSTVG